MTKKHFSSTGNNLPYTLYGAASVPYNDSFLLVGGFTLDTFEYRDTILLYIPESDSWIELPTKLETPRYYHTVIPVERSIFPECKGEASSTRVTPIILFFIIFFVFL